MNVLYISKVLHELLKGAVDTQGLKVVDHVPNRDGKALVKSTTVPAKRGFVRIITQNPNKPSVWARMFKAGQEVSHVYAVQTEDQVRGRHIGRIVDRRYFRDAPKSKK